MKTQREIKFRAWEKYDEGYAKEMGVSGEMHYGDAWGENEELQEKRTVVISGFYHDSGWSWEDFTPMQYTGLKDKNGVVEVYEGDIIDPLGNIKGNIYESPQIYKEGIDCLIEGLGTKKWRNTESVAMGFGCKYAE